MKEYKNEIFYYCQECKEAQKLVANPMGIHICTDCGEEYDNDSLIIKVEKVRVV